MPAYSTYTDEQLYELLQGDDQDAFTEIYQRYWKTLYQRARAMLNDGPLAQDVVQEVFISLWNRRADARIEKVGAYLHQAVRFQELKALHRLQSDAAFYDRLASITQDLINHEPLLYNEMESIVRNLLSRLPEDQRNILRLSREEGLTYREIAEKLGISIKTVEKKISLSLRAIRKGMDGSFPVLLSFALVAPAGVAHL
jgi:RNA polymerase sigma-70 factor (ECF subfamily)